MRNREKFIILIVVFVITISVFNFEDAYVFAEGDVIKIETAEKENQNSLADKFLNACNNKRKLTFELKKGTNIEAIKNEEYIKIAEYICSNNGGEELEKEFKDNLKEIIIIDPINTNEYGQHKQKVEILFKDKSSCEYEIDINIRKFKNLINKDDENTPDIQFNKFVPRIGDEIELKMWTNSNNRDSYIFYNNKDKAIKLSHFSFLLNYEENAFNLEEIIVPKFKFNKENEEDNGYYISSSFIDLDNKFDLTGNKEVYEDYIINNEYLKKSNLNIKKDINSINNFNLFVNGKMDNKKEDIVNYFEILDPFIFKYTIEDIVTRSPYFQLQSNYNVNIGQNIHEYYYVPIHKVYYETSDIELYIEESEKEKGFKPGDEVNLEVKIKNTSENIPNSRLVPSLDIIYGDKKESNILFDFKEEKEVDVPIIGKYEDIKDGKNIQVYLPDVLNPKDEISFSTKIKIPENLPKDIKNIELKPSLSTSSEKINDFKYFEGTDNEYYQIIYGDANFLEELHLDEKESNDSIELKITDEDINNEDINNEDIEKDDLNKESDYNVKRSSRKRSVKIPKMKEIKKDKTIRQKTNTGYPFDTLNDRAYIKGYEDGTFRPGKSITREEVSTILYRVLDENYRNNKKTNINKFNDVENSRWSNTEISTLKKANVIEGYEDGTFRPKNNMTRAETSAVLARFYKLTGDNQNKFSDTKGHWAEKYINIVVEKGLIKGYEDGEFKPDQEITRAEFVTIINRLLERNLEKTISKEDLKEFDDINKSDWHYEDILEAANGHEYVKENNLEK